MFFGVIDKNLVRKQGGCLERYNWNLRFWPKTGGGCLSGAGVFGMKGTVSFVLEIHGKITYINDCL